MLNYFDKDFFKFLFGFLAIVLISLIIILVAKIYSSEAEIGSPTTTSDTTR